MAAGTPVIALRSGGVKETVVEGKTGTFFEEPTVDSLVSAIKQFNNLTIKPSDCVRQAKKFSKNKFKKTESVDLNFSFNPNQAWTRLGDDWQGKKEDKTINIFKKT